MTARSWVKPWFGGTHLDVPGLHTSQPHYLHLNQDVRPSWIKHIHVYELAPDVADPDVRSIVADAMAIPRLDQVDAIIREYGIVGAWRPTDVLIEVVDQGRNFRIVENGTPAHAVWNLDLHQPISPNSSLSLALTNTSERDRTFRAVLTATEMTDKELGLEPGNQRCRNDGSLDDTEVLSQLAARISQLERLYAKLAKTKG